MRLDLVAAGKNTVKVIAVRQLQANKPQTDLVKFH